MLFSQFRQRLHQLDSQPLKRDNDLMGERTFSDDSEIKGSWFGYSPKCLWSNRDHDGPSLSANLANDQSIGGVQGDCSDFGVSQMLSNFQNESMRVSFNFQGVQNGQKPIFELLQ